MSKMRTNNNFKKMNKKGFIMTLDAAISFLLLVLIIISFSHQEEYSLKELAIIQQENDLLRVWSAKETSEGEMIKDITWLFEEAGVLYINEKKVYGNEKENCISSSTEILNRQTLVEKNITIAVCK